MAATSTGTLGRFLYRFILVDTEVEVRRHGKDNRFQVNLLGLYSRGKLFQSPFHMWLKHMQQVGRLVSK